MKKYSIFIGTGFLFSTAEEFLSIIVLRHDVASFLFTFFILFPFYLSFVYFSSKLIRYASPHPPTQELIHYFAYGVIGLIIEWFIIGLAPWKDAVANPVLLIVFNLVMFCFLATVAFAPRIFITPGELSDRMQNAIQRFFIPYFMIVYVVAFTVPDELKFLTIITMIIFGYLFLNMLFLRYLVLAFNRTKN